MALYLGRYTRMGTRFTYFSDSILDFFNLKQLVPWFCHQMFSDILWVKLPKSDDFYTVRSYGSLDLEP